MNTLGKELLYVSLDGETSGQTSGADTAATSRKTCFIIAWSGDTLCLRDLLTRDSVDSGLPLFLTSCWGLWPFVSPGDWHRQQPLPGWWARAAPEAEQRGKALVPLVLHPPGYLHWCCVLSVAINPTVHKENPEVMRSRVMRHDSITVVMGKVVSTVKRSDTLLA